MEMKCPLCEAENLRSVVIFQGTTRDMAYRLVEWDEKLQKIVSHDRCLGKSAFKCSEGHEFEIKERVG